ncbi:UDP-4-amino-4-deoxy-L-arabinose--oxoglutarate aminotransferase [uncultured archaeon]|nr:UDP-4-amino-4-deoxy-L-arabinose--oxoglutarate aminotransferase [uncultured archaeon]
MIPISKPIIGKEEKRAILDVLSSGMLAQGEKTAQFEENFARYVGADYAVATNNGTTALFLALNALNIKGEVLLPSFTFIASATSVLFNNAKPVFVDVDPQTFNIDTRDLEKKITNKTEAIMSVHLYGHACDMDAIREIAKKHNLKIIEDACQAHGAEYNGKKAGALGDAAAFSFYPTKNMTTGEGGIVTTNDLKEAETMRLFRNHGQAKRYIHNTLGYNFRMTDIQAAIGIEQLKKLDSFNEKRISNASYYDKHLENVEIPSAAKNVKHVYHQYTLKSESRDSLKERLEKNNIGYGIYYPIPAHMQEVMVAYKTALPITEGLCKKVISIPIHPSLKKSDLKQVVSVINNN